MSPRAYLDGASTQPLRPEVRAELLAAWSEPAADPGRIHTEGSEARAQLEHARDRVAAAVGTRGRSVVFTSGGTEAIAAACFGAAQRGPHSVAAPVEHSAVRSWAERGPVTWVDVDTMGRVDPGALLDAIRSDTGIVHLQWANHEVGTRQRLTEVVAGCREAGVLCHVDACGALGHDEIAFDELGADLMSVSGHKLGGPPGVGALLVRRGVRLDPLLVGGDQERGRRAGMEPVGLARGFAVAVDVAVAGRPSRASFFRGQTDRVAAWARGFPGVRVLGDPVDRLDHLLCLGFDDVEPQPVLIGLDQAGVAVHSGSSCASEGLEPSPVLAAMGVDDQRSMRISLSWSTTAHDVDRFLAVAPDVLSSLGALRSRYTAPPN
ncbi:MAG: cysteine desulfurase family protein [Microthrixaceae bacterium]